MSKVSVTVATDNERHDFSGDITIVSVASKTDGGYDAKLALIGAASSKDVAAILGNIVMGLAANNANNDKMIEMFMLTDIKTKIDSRIKELLKNNS